MLLIFWFSAQEGDSSGEMSDGFILQMISVIEKIGNISLDHDKIITLFVLPVRKFAHFFIYFVLGILWMSLLKEYQISLTRQIIYALLFCLLYACTDEFHQLFVSGRDGKIFDVLVDMTGCLCSIISIYLFRKYKNKTVS